MRTKILTGMAIILGGLLFYHILPGRNDAQAWIEFSSPESRFEILMPGRPVTGKVVEPDCQRSPLNCIPSQL
jgi:hypothetical protein